MSSHPGATRRRRNTVGPRDAVFVRVVAAAAATAASTAACAPTGRPVADALWCALVAAAVTWASATAPWWALLGAAGVATAGASSGPIALLVLAAVATVAAAVIAERRASAPVVRCAVGAVVANVMLRAEWTAVQFGSAAVAAVVMTLLVVTGLSRRGRTTRRWAVRIAGSMALLFVASLVGLVIAALGSRSDADAGNDALRAGLTGLGSGETGAASESLHEAALRLDDASSAYDSWWAAPARILPLLAPQREALADVTSGASDAAESAADAVGLIQPDQLSLVGGALDVDAIALVAEPLDDLATDLDTLAAQMDAGRSPWLLPALTDRLDRTADAIEPVRIQVATARSLAASVPRLFGGEGERRYLVAFTNPAESRGQGGLIGNWSELTAVDGAITLTASGRTSELIAGLEAADAPLLDMPTEFLQRYGAAGAARPPDGELSPRFWSNVTMSADMPSVGAAMAQMYELSTGRTVDAVALIDPTGVAALLRLTGPIEVDGLDSPLSTGTAVDFLGLGQYERPQAEREAILEAATEATMDTLTTQVVADPVAIGDALGRAAIEGHLLVWFADTDDQDLAAALGIDGALPRHGRGDGLAVTVVNGGGNKIDTFLDVDVDYRPVVDGRDVRAHLTVTLDNSAPASGYPDYVIGNLVDLPTGTNRALIDIYTPLRFTGATVDDVPTTMASGTERGWNVFTAAVVVGPGATSTLEVDLTGRIDVEAYSLVLRPQALPNPVSWHIEATEPGGRVVAGFVGRIERRSLLDGSGIAPWEQR